VGIDGNCRKVRKKGKIKATGPGEVENFKLIERSRRFQVKAAKESKRGESMVR